MGARPVPEVLEGALQWIAPIAGLALAAALSVAPSIRSSATASPRVRVSIGLAAFGLIHLLAQRKGWPYHVYPLGVGLACWGAWALAALPRRRAVLCLAVTAFGMNLAVIDSDAPGGFENYAPLRAAAAMQTALERHLPRGARVQMLDADNGASLAMARAGMRQATRHVQWMMLTANEGTRRDFLAALEADPPAAILLTNAQWPKSTSFEPADEWQELKAFLASRYNLSLTGTEDDLSWRFYLRWRADEEIVAPQPRCRYYSPRPYAVLSTTID
jgi:hypothetical protein